VHLPSNPKFQLKFPEISSDDHGTAFSRIPCKDDIITRGAFHSTKNSGTFKMANCANYYCPWKVYEKSEKKVEFPQYEPFQPNILEISNKNQMEQ